MSKPKKGRERIDNSTFTYMVIVAVAIDFFIILIGGLFFIAGLIPILGLAMSFMGYILATLLTSLGYMLFLTWFHILGYSMSDWDGEQAALMGASYLAELTPFVGMFPWFSISVIRMATLVRRKDRGYTKRNAHTAPHGTQRPTRDSNLTTLPRESLAD